MRIENQGDYKAFVRSLETDTGIGPYVSKEARYDIPVGVSFPRWPSFISTQNNVGIKTEGLTLRNARSELKGLEADLLRYLGTFLRNRFCDVGLYMALGEVQNKKELVGKTRNYGVPLIDELTGSWNAKGDTGWYYFKLAGLNDSVRQFGRGFNISKCSETYINPREEGEEGYYEDRFKVGFPDEEEDKRKIITIKRLAGGKVEILEGSDLGDSLYGIVSSMYDLSNDGHITELSVDGGTDDENGYWNIGIQSYMTGMSYSAPSLLPEDFVTLGTPELHSITDLYM